MSHWETSGASDEWYTPKYIFDALGTAFDLDVAAPNSGGDCVPAKLRYTRRGLSDEWFGFVWMNPPFGGRNGLAPWLAKFIAHGNGIALVPDRTSAPWFQDAFPRMDAVLFTRKIRFIRPDGSEGKSPSNGTALMAIGSVGVAALQRACGRGLGIICEPGLSHIQPVDDVGHEAADRLGPIPSVSFPHDQFDSPEAQQHHVAR